MEGNHDSSRIFSTKDISDNYNDDINTSTSQQSSNFLFTESVASSSIPSLGAFEIQAAENAIEIENVRKVKNHVNNNEKSKKETLTVGGSTSLLSPDSDTKKTKDNIVLKKRAEEKRYRSDEKLKHMLGGSFTDEMSGQQQNHNIVDSIKSPSTVCMEDTNDSVNSIIHETDNDEDRDNNNNMVSPLTAESLKDSNKKSSIISPTTDNTNDQDSFPSSAFSPAAAASSENEKMDIHDGDSISPLTDFTTNKKRSSEQKSHKQHNNIIRQNHEERSKNKLRGMLGESFILEKQQQNQHQGKKKDVDVVMMRRSRENSKQELIELAHSKQAREQRTITKLRDMLGQDVVPLSNIRPSKESLNNNKKLRHMLGQNFVPTEEVHPPTEEEIHQSSSIDCINHQKEKEEEKKEILDPITATPCEKLKGIFTLDPTNNICADCSKVLTTTSSSLTMFDLQRNRRNSSDLIYISFQRPYNSKCRSSSSSYTVSTRNPLVPTDKFTIRPTTFFSRNDFGVQHVKCMPMSSIFSSRDHTLSFSVFICQDCAAIHRKILDNKRRNHNKQYYGLKCVQDKNEIWTESEVKYLSLNRGNKYADSILERYMPKEFKHRIRWDSLNSIADMDSEKEVFIRAKYQTLSFLFPYGPLNPYHTLKSISNGNKRKDTWLIHPGVSNDATNNNKKQQKKKHSMVPPKRLVDFFCVLGSKDTTEQSIKKLKRDNDKSSSSSSSSKTKKNWEDVEFDTQILDCYPPKNHYDDMDFPEHVSKFVFPDECKLSRTWEKPSFFTFVLTLETGMRLYGASLRIYDTFLSLGDEEEVVYYVPKVLAVLSHYPFFDTYQKFLKLIYKVSRTPSSPLPIERFVVHFCREVPLPPPGRVEIIIRYDNLHPLKLRRPPKNQLPLVNFSYRALFASLSISNILVIFGLMLEESRIVICSEYYSLLTPVCEALLSLLFPFSWRGPYIPVMPVSMIDVLDAPFPFLIGLHSSVLYSGILEDKPGVVFVDLDRDKIILGYEEKNFQMYNRQTPALPAKDALKLKSSLEEHGCSKVYIDTITKQKGLVVHNIGGNGKKQMFVSNSERDSYAYGVERESAFMHVSDFSSPQLKRKTSSLSSTSPASKASPPSDSNKNTTNAISKKRKEMFGLAESAFDEFERMDLKSFAAEVGTLVESEHGTSPTTVKNVKPKKKKLSKYIPSTSSSSSSNNDKKKDSDNNMKCNILDPKYDEDSSFSAIGVRQSFLRFFVSVFKNYSKFIITQDENGMSSHNRRFRDESFLNDLGYFGRTRNHLSLLLESQMFERFIEERIENPQASEFLFFDESILAKLNRSIMSTTYTTRTTSNLLHSKGYMPAVKLTKKNITPFLDDTSDNHTSVYTPPPPSYWGLPDDVTYSYREFPILNSELFGKIRTPTVNWPESNSSSNDQKKTNQTRKSVNVMDPKLLMRQTKAMSLIFGAEDPDIMKSSLAANKVMESVVKLPESPQLRNVEWAIHALAYKTTTTTTTTTLSLNNNTNKMKPSTKKSSSLSPPPHHQISVRPIPKDLLTSAHCITLQAQNQQTILLWIIIRIQSIYRMHYTQNSYQTILIYIRKIQRIWRQHRICKTHGRVLNYYLECVKTIQAFCRRSLAIQKFKKTVSALQLLQRQARCWQTRNFFLNAKKTAILAQSIQRSRRCRFGFLFLKFKVTKVQSAIRGHLCRKHVQKFISQRIQDYRKQIVLLWKKAHVSLEYRSHFWVLFGGDHSSSYYEDGGIRQRQTTHTYHQTFMNLGIHEDELRRLWDAVGFKDADPDIPTEVVHYSGVGEAKSFDGVCSEFKQHFLWVQTKLMEEEEEEKKDLYGKEKNNRNNYPSSLISGRRSTTASVETSHYSVGNENDRWIAMMTMNPRVVSLERLRIYEKLNKSSETTKRTHYAKMGIAVKDKKKKQNLAQDLWLDYEKADESANIVINIMNAIHQERSLKANNKTPSRRRLKRFGLLSRSGSHTTEVASSFTNNTNNYLITSGYDQWIKEKIDKRIRYNLKTTVHALLLGVQNLSVIVKQANLGGEVKNNKYESEAFQRQQKALFFGKNNSEEEGSKQCQFIEKYVNGFSQ